MQEKFTWNFENFSSLQDGECRYSPTFKAGVCDWYLRAVPRIVMKDPSYVELSVYLYSAPGLLPPRRGGVKYRITFVNVNPQHNKVIGERCFMHGKKISGFDDFLSLDKLRNESEGFLVDDSLTIVVEIEIFEGDSPNCRRPQVAQDAASSQEKLNTDDDDDAFEDDYDLVTSDDDDDASDDDDDDDLVTSEERSDDAPDDDAASDDDDAFEDDYDLVTSEESSDDAPDDDDASDDDDDDDDDLVTSEERSDDASDDDDDASDDDDDYDLVTSEESSDDASDDDDDDDDEEIVKVNGFNVFSSQVESANHIFQRHPDVAIDVRPKNQQIRSTYMNELLDLTEMMCKSPEKLSKYDLIDAKDTLDDLAYAGFKLDWLETKLDKIIKKKKMQQGSRARLQTMEALLEKLEEMFLDLESQLRKEKVKALAARTPLSFNDVVS